jgi:hypothetical protein
MVEQDGYGAMNELPDFPGDLQDVLRSTPFIDIHTHLFAAEFGELGLWGIDELLTYHYLEAELFRFCPIQPAAYWAMNKREKADLIWRELFVENTPISEATRGVIFVLHALGLDPQATDLREAREFFSGRNLPDHITEVFRLAGVDQVVMTNDPLDAAEAKHWNSGVQRDPRFQSALRLDHILNDWEAHVELLRVQGFSVERDLAGSTMAEIRRFLEQCCERMRPRYMAVSLPDTFAYPAEDARSRLLAEAVLPTCREGDIPLSMMIGVRRNVNPALRLAGDASGRADLRALETLCRDFPENRFLVSVLSRENQHELCVYARKFRNLLPFGCWWFLNNPSIVEEITRERIEMLGLSFIPQHSDARVLEQLIYKWHNTRRTMAPILRHAYNCLNEDGGDVTRAQIERDVVRLFRENFLNWTGLTSHEQHVS